MQTITGSSGKVLGKADLCLRLGRLELSHQRLVADIVDEVIIGTDIKNPYGFVVDFKENFVSKRR